MKKVIITGATSFLGIHTVDECLNRGYEVIAVIRPNSTNIGRIKKNSKLRIIELDMFEYHRIIEFVQTADYFFHFAWEGVRAPERDDREIQIKNHLGTICAYEAALKMDCSCFIGAGSQAEYGFIKDEVDEKYQCHPITAYGIEKYNTCIMLGEKSKLDKIRFVWPRIFSLYGPYDGENTLIMTALNKMNQDERIDLTECRQQWDYLYVKDASRAYIMLAENEHCSGIFNIASGTFRPLKEYVAEIKYITKSKSELFFGTIPYEVSGPINLMPVVTKIKVETGWKPNYSFEDGIKEIIKQNN